MEQVQGSVRTHTTIVTAIYRQNSVAVEENYFIHLKIIIIKCVRM